MRVMITEKESPKMIDKASGAQNDAVKSSGMIPITVVRVVNMIGRNREADPSSTTSVTGSVGSCFRILFMTSIRMIELFTTIPTNAIRPIKAGNDNALPVIKSPSAIPMNDKNAGAITYTA